MPKLLRKLFPRRQSVLTGSADAVEVQTHADGAEGHFGEGEDEEVDVRALIDEHHAKHQVVLWIKSGCPYCQASHDLLLKQMKGLDVALHNLSKAPQGHIVLEELQLMTGRVAVPYIFVRNKFIGGNAELQELYHADKLEKKLFPDITDDDVTYRAIWKGVVVAECSDPVVVRGMSYYFPPESVQWQYLSESRNYTTHCSWKGEASYWHIRIPGKGRTYKNAAWAYKTPLPEAEHFKDHVCFEEKIAVMKGRELLRTTM